MRIDEIGAGACDEHLGFKAQLNRFETPNAAVDEVIIDEWDKCHTHSMSCGPLHQHPQHMACMVHMPHTQHGLWADAPTPTAHGMHGTHSIG